MGAPGESPSAETRRKIGEAARRRYLERLKSKPDPLPEKPCSKCRKVKPLRDFYVRKKKLKSGILSEIPDSWCKECTIRIQGERWERMKEEGIDVAALKRVHYEAENAEKRLERRREYQAIQRRKKGRPVRKLHSPPETREHVMAAPIVQWLRSWDGLAARDDVDRFDKSVTLLSERTGVPPRRIYGLLREESSKVRLSTVDKILVGLDLPHLLHELYPEESK